MASGFDRVMNGLPVDVQEDLHSRRLDADIRPADPQRDAGDGITPALMVEPLTRDAVAGTLRWASDHRLRVRVEGAGTKRMWGRGPDRVDVLLSMRRMNRVLAHRAGDLTVSVEAGATLREVNQALAAHRQRLALDPPFADRATIGGLLATNDSGPERHRFGTPRDLVIGVELATTDGSIAKAGGQVVKNVAGYDLSKVVSGSFGTLAVITGATFKLSPIPPASATVKVAGLGPEDLSRVLDVIGESWLEPVAFELHASADGASARDAACLLRFASLPSAVDAQASDACARIGALRPGAEVVTGDAERQLWAEHASAIWRGDAAMVRVSWMPADAPSLLSLLEGVGRVARVEFIGRLGVGAGLLRIEGDEVRQAQAIARLRESRLAGNVVLVRASAALEARVGASSDVPNAPLYRAIKQALDPNGILVGGRWPR